ncbi:alkaline phosphatase family protein [Mycetocola spongiae]|uniref:alkaline phosphatase family protein n=1 Tax=Mycetocola spongiae TaxID=2859226 RepID=UPI001CF2EF6E|nr:alkaline phosphatase family protein [Mycetocola spongiae]
MPNILASLRGERSTLSLLSARSAILVVVDGLGAQQLRASSSYARFLTATKVRSIASVFPSTTAAALATITTGVLPGRHGLVGYEALDPAGDRIVNQLTGWDAGMDPATWQRARTGFECAREEGIDAIAVGPARYADTGFSRAVLRGARYVAAQTIAERFEAAAAEVRSGRSLVYLYIPELDQISHRAGWESEEWLHALEEVDSAVRRCVSALPRDVGLVLTADHGSVDVPEHAQILFDHKPGLVDHVRHIGGEPRMRHLYFQPEATADQREAVRERWIAEEGHRARISTREEAIASGQFGEVDPEVAPRIGDLIIAARKRVVYYDSRPADQRSRGMIGQHGSLSEEESQVPWILAGAYSA